MSEIRNFEIFFYNDLLICPDCSKNFKLHKQVYNIDGIPLYVLYEYDEFLERLFFQYKEQRDVVLKDIYDIENRLGTNNSNTLEGNDFERENYMSNRDVKIHMK